MSVLRSNPGISKMNIQVRRCIRTMTLQKTIVVQWISRKFSTSIYNPNICIDVSPKNALLDNVPKIRVEGLKENQDVTLWNTYIDDAGFEFTSHAHYIANQNGAVDVQNDMSYGGKYDGIFLEGLVSSMQTAPPVYQKKPSLKWARFYKKNVTKPMEFKLKVVDGHVSENELYSSSRLKTIGETKFTRYLMADGVRRIELEKNRVRGALFLPHGDGPFPLVLDIHGAESGTKEARSAMFASYGYAALALPYYSYKDLPKILGNIDLNYFLEAIDALNNIPEAHSGRIGLIGSCKGGEIALALAGLSKSIKACITVNCYNMSIDVDYYLDNKLYLEKYSANKETTNIYLKDGELHTYCKTPYYKWNSKYSLPIEKIHDDCHVLLTAGDEDGGHSHRSAMALKERARKLNKDKVSVLIYPGVGHLIDPPYHSHTDAVWTKTIIVRKEDGSRYEGLPHFYGGNSYNLSQASTDLWRRVLAIFHRRLVQEAGLPVNKTKLYSPHVY